MEMFYLPFVERGIAIAILNVEFLHLYLKSKWHSLCSDWLRAGCESLVEKFLHSLSSRLVLKATHTRMQWVS
jgi:hypothetical protein